VPFRRASAWVLLGVALMMASGLAGASRKIAEPVLALSLATVAVELMILTLAICAALVAPGSPRVRLGLVAWQLGATEMAALAAGTLGLSHALDALLALSGLAERSGLADFARTLEGARGLPLAAAVIAVGLLPALAEELLCRGVLQRTLVGRLGAAPAILLAAIAFGLLHVDPIHGAAATLLGVYLGIAGHWSGSVLVPIACHAVNNLAAVGEAVRSGPTLEASPEDVAVGVALAAISLAWVGWRRTRRLQPAPGSVDG